MRTYNPAHVHQVLADMGWERMRDYTHRMTAAELLATHLFVMSEILHNQESYEELWRRVREVQGGHWMPVPITITEEQKP